MTLYFLGGGNMAAAIIGRLRQHRPELPIHVANRGAEKRGRLAAQFGVAVSEKLPVLTEGDILVLAVKPQDMQAACSDIQTGGALVLSVAAGLDTGTLAQYLGGSRRIIRCIPNTPCAVGEGVTGLFAAEGVSEADRSLAQSIMQACGITLWLEQEEQLHGLTGISGSGSAYVFYLMAALAEAARRQGFDGQQARLLSLATFKGAVALAEQSGEDFTVLEQNVTSKGGTTAAALEVFRRKNTEDIIAEGAAACVRRSREIAAQFKNT
ncbi:MAG: pyrroline-5-carboxylate reductase [Neisseria sp.]|nr:pyrroline-5-carboxylate reductase [Neisseria sp.]